MQTHEWEALLDGTTPRPWEATDERDYMGIKGPDGLTLIDVNEGWSRCTRADLALAAHAPAAVAEVIRTTDELLALDPDTAVTFYGWEGATIWDARYIQSRVDEEDYSPDLPAVIVATAEQVRQAREAIGAAREEWETRQ